MVNLYMLFLVLVLAQILAIPMSYGQQTFGPPSDREKVYALKTENPIQIDGQLSEAVWKETVPYFGFTQREPVQGNLASYDTEVRVVYDHRFLYIAAINKEDLSKKSNIRVLNMQRDFEAYQNDRFGVAIDGFMDGQNAIGFEVTPYGAQRDVQVLDGEERTANRNWDGLWFVKTSITDTAWIAEIAIPWKTIRYPAQAKDMLVSFTRNQQFLLWIFWQWAKVEAGHNPARGTLDDGTKERAKQAPFRGVLTERGGLRRPLPPLKGLPIPVCQGQWQIFLLKWELLARM